MKPSNIRALRRVHTKHHDVPDCRRRRISSFGYTQSQALVYAQHGEPSEVLQLHRYSIPPAYGSNVTLRFLAAPINPADINQIQGSYPSRPDFTHALGTAQPSAVGGNEGVAEVVATGSGVGQVRRGDWVIMRRPCFGTWRTYAAAASEDELLRLDDREGVSALQAATVGVNPCTAYGMLRGFVRLDAEAGDWFIQNGANSGVGRAAIQLGRLWGYKSINVVRARPDLPTLRADLTRLGADVVVTDDELRQDPRGFEDRVREWTRGGREKVRLGLNCVGGQVVSDMARVLAEDACVVTYGAMARRPVPVPAGLMIFKNLRYLGFWVSRWAEQQPDEKKRVVEELLSLMRDGRLKDTPVREIEWASSGVDVGVLKEEVARTFEGFRGAKGVFVFKE